MEIADRHSSDEVQGESLDSKAFWVHSAWLFPCDFQPYAQSRQEPILTKCLNVACHFTRPIFCSSKQLSWKTPRSPSTFHDSEVKPERATQVASSEGAPPLSQRILQHLHYFLK